MLLELLLRTLFLKTTQIPTKVQSVTLGVYYPLVLLQLMSFLCLLAPLYDIISIDNSKCIPSC